MHLLLLTGALALAASLAVPASAGTARDARDVPVVDQAGTTFTLRDLRRPTAVVFIDLDCDDACTIAEGVFAKLAVALDKEHVDARLVTLTLDPEADPPIAMAAMARRFGADATRWHWASGAPANVKALMSAFHVVRVNRTEHSTFCYLLDAHGLPSRVIPLSTAADGELLAGLRALAHRRT
ncbi:hypothetical protein WPS_30240 [Vulcanimicrobium alpinum]|uniref:Thioredoxin domain-containing protein n=1 Tax=Vulcanimicrobium alpinum TaxID=3016050 RepID=A0AAN1Y048_UNVUL|nr:SCO family protein [Vulcanimicrobium alpinum]BDE07748.1 hypothetical protein WPS_30240 [Vulcanimicrobium alpinum]